ncbi:thiamine biosynthesis protein ApbE [Sphingomonas sp. Leaf16]|nr:thiamine biosynthesis protein ApbE [Sphingomonas sp. Leaf16]KQN15217.1 thiamine biosynthesis protein ApbE [Sphingomonas sp. Leaf29]KQN20751.1 thiamine biosynthesis protein ApbE [Sphingomonas sp. Leaf32]
MGTSWTVLAALPPAMAGAAALLQRAIAARLTDLVAQLSHWEPASALCQFNALPPGGVAVLPDDLARVIDLSLRIAHASDGAFDPAIGRLVDLWGYGPPGPCPPPAAAAIDAARAVSGWQRLRFDPARARLRQPGGLALDLSGVAKGYAVDAVADLLAAQGVHHCLVEIGGELVGRGMRPDGDAWWVDLEDPPGAAFAPLRLALHESAVATSGNYRRGDHSIDPRTGCPADNGVLSVSVVAPSAMLADALATAIAVAGPDSGVIPALDVAARIVVRDCNGVREILTPRLRAMLG